MKSIFIALLLTLFPALHGLAQSINQTAIDEGTGREILLGYADRNGLSVEPYSTWFEEEYDQYQPDEAVLEKIHPDKLEGITITMILGTWCPDSRREVPRFYKILDMISFNEARMQVICVDTRKQAPGIDLAALELEYVPTFIFFRSNTEIGRIVEMPLESLEKDMLSILTSE